MARNYLLIADQIEDGLVNRDEGDLASVGKACIG